MAANAPSGPVQQIGTDANPIVVGVGSKTWTHGKGQRAAAVWALKAGDRGLVPETGVGFVSITQPSANAITLTNPGAPVSLILMVEWEVPSPAKAAVSAESLFV